MKFSKYVFLVVFSVVTLVGCGGKEKKEKVEPSHKKKEVVVKEAKVISNDVVITASDNMKFNTKKIIVSAGKKVKITLKHMGKMDKKFMGHNFVLLKKGVSLFSFGKKASAAKATEYIPKDSQDIIAHTNIIGGGETAVIEFDAPEPGTYNFLCSFPGHYAIMKGKFIVE